MLKPIGAAVMIAVVSLAAFSAPSGAQINPFARSDFVLTPDDVTLLTAAAAKLYQGETAALGTVEEWSNAKSGNRGRVELIRIFEHRGQACRRLQHDITLADTAAGPFRFIIDRCKVSANEWKML